MAPNMDAYSMPCTTRVPKRCVAANASSVWIGFVSPVRRAKSLTSAAVKVRAPEVDMVKCRLILLAVQNATTIRGSLIGINSSDTSTKFGRGIANLGDHDGLKPDLHPSRGLSHCECRP